MIDDTGCLFGINAHSQGGETPSSITKDEASNLLRRYLRSEGYDTKSARLDLEMEKELTKISGSTFYLFDAYANTPQRLVTIGFYGINAETGDIWERLTCKRVESPSIRAIQKQIRKVTHVSSDAFKRSLNINPCF